MERSRCDRENFPVCLGKIKESTDNATRIFLNYPRHIRRNEEQTRNTTRSLYVHTHLLRPATKKLGVTRSFLVPKNYRRTDVKRQTQGMPPISAKFPQMMKTKHDIGNFLDSSPVLTGNYTS